MKDRHGTGLKPRHTRQMWTTFTACYFNSVYGVTYLLHRPYIWKSATPKPLELEFWYMLSINDRLLLYDITKRQPHWSLDGYGTPLHVTYTLQAVGRIPRLLLPSLALWTRLPCMSKLGCVNIDHLRGTKGRAWKRQLSTWGCDLLEVSTCIWNLEFVLNNFNSLHIFNIFFQTSSECNCKY